MSEYQFYEWQTADRLLSDAEQEAVRQLSSHIEVSASHAVATYSWGDFKHDPLAARKAETWKEVEVFVESRQTTQYDASVKLLVKLRQLADFQNAGDDFLKQVTDLCARFRKRPGFLQRVREAKVLE